MSISIFLKRVIFRHHERQIMSAQSQNNHTSPLVVLTTLFFMMGFITCMNDILIPHLKEIFDLSYVQAMLIQFCFFTAYAVMSIPMGGFCRQSRLQKRRYRRLSADGGRMPAVLSCCGQPFLRGIFGRVVYFGFRRNAASGRR